MSSIGIPLEDYINTSVLSFIIKYDAFGGVMSSTIKPNI